MIKMVLLALLAVLQVVAGNQNMTTFFKVDNWNDIVARSQDPIANTRINGAIRIYYTMDPRTFMKDMVNELLAFSSSKGYSHTSILKVLNHLGLIKNSFITASAFTEQAIRTLSYHSQSIHLAKLYGDTNDKRYAKASLKYAEFTSKSAAIMVEESENQINSFETPMKIINELSYEYNHLYVDAQQVTRDCGKCASKNLKNFDITLKVLSNLRTLLLHANTPWYGIKRHAEIVQSINQQELSMLIEEDIDEYQKVIAYYGYSLLAFAKICGDTAAVMREASTECSIVDLGCWKDTKYRAIQGLEGKSTVLDGPYASRENSFEKCKQAAHEKGYTVFALQAGGWCASSSIARISYKRHGAAAGACPEKGGAWINHVYRIDCSKDVEKLKNALPSKADATDLVKKLSNQMMGSLEKEIEQFKQKIKNLQ